MKHDDVGSWVSSHERPRVRPDGSPYRRPGPRKFPPEPPVMYPGSAGGLSFRYHGLPMLVAMVLALWVAIESLVK